MEIEIAIIVVAAFLTALLTFFSGFGLGTIMTPVFALFFPIEIAISLTAVVHFANNIYKSVLVGKHANWSILLLFGLPAFVGSFVGANVLLWVARLSPWIRYSLMGHEFEVVPINLLIALLLIVFSISELLPASPKWNFGRKGLIPGGLLSGFFGGLSGMQGAIRGAFLIKLGLNKKAYIATNALIACMADFSRLIVYTTLFTTALLQENAALLIFACLAAFTGVTLGKALLNKVTLRFVQVLVAVMLIIIAIGLGAGFI